MSSRSRRGARWAGLGLALAALTLCLVAEARPGGGGSYRGSSGGGSGGGGSGGGGDVIIYLVFQAFRLLFVLTLEYPAIGIPIDIIVVVGGAFAYFRFKRWKRRDPDGWDTMVATFSGEGPSYPTEARTTLPRRSLEALRGQDPNFSVVLFEDFAYALFATAHQARGQSTLDQLSPYLSQPARATLAQRSPSVAQVRDVIIGAMRVTSVSQVPDGPYGPGKSAVTLEFEANYTEALRTGQQQAYYVMERWTLQRGLSARSRPPETARAFVCPSCGAPLTAIRGSQCGSCQRVVDSGEFGWIAVSIQLVTSEPRGPILTSDLPEQGTRRPTIVAPDAAARFQQLSQQDPNFSWGSFQSRVAMIFAELQVAWSSREWMRARPYLSDQLFQMQQTWVDAYKAARLRNVSENARVLQIEVAAIASDAYYDAVTVRVHATGLDYTLSDDTGKVVAGSRTKERAYTEYWTMIRGRGVRRPASTAPQCPRCGGPLSINMTGSCTYCDAKITSGAFDWVLSRIEQDDSYVG